MLFPSFSKFFLLSIGAHFLLFFLVFFAPQKSYTPAKTFKTKIYFEKKTKQVTRPITKKNTTKTTANSSKRKALPNLDLKSLSLDSPIQLKQIKSEDAPAPKLKAVQLNKNLGLGELDKNILQNNLEKIDQKIDIQDNSQNNLKITQDKNSTQNNITPEQAEYLELEYKNLIGSIIRSNWTSSFGDETLQVVIKVTILKSGSLLSYEVIEKSTLLSFDLSALNAIKSSAPLPAIPENYNLEEYTMFFRFQGGRILAAE